MKPKISVIVPIYNVADYIGDTIESVINQDYCNWELILIDDGSPDNSGEICDIYAKKDSRIKVVHKENGGVCAARLTGIEIASGEYITLLDGDDTLTYDALSTMLKYALEDKSDLIICNFIQVRDGYTFEWRRFGETGVMTKDEYVNKLIRFKLPLSTQAKLFHKSVIANSDLVIDRRIKNNEDFLTNLLVARNLHQISAYNSNVYVVSTREGSASKTEYQFDYWIFLMNYVVSNADRFGLDEQQLGQYILTRTFHLIRSVNQLTFNFTDPVFDYIRSMKVSEPERIWEKIIVFVVKHPSQFLIRLLRIHPTLLIPYFRKRRR